MAARVHTHTQLPCDPHAADDLRMNELYVDTLGMLSAGGKAGAALALAENPDAYALQLAERVTGTPVAMEGFSPVYDVLLKVAPPVALTPAGVKRGHEQVCTSLLAAWGGGRPRATTMGLHCIPRRCPLVPCHSSSHARLCG